MHGPPSRDSKMRMRSRCCLRGPVRHNFKKSAGLTFNEVRPAFNLSWITASEV